MKQLILMRHAKAEAQSASGEDYDRALNARGQDEARRVARALKSYGLRPDLCLVSGAVRTRQTFEAVNDVFADTKETLSANFSDTLYNADDATIMRMIENHEETKCLMVIAHNPGLQYLALALMKKGAAAPSLIDSLGQSFPTATACVFVMDRSEKLIYDGHYLAKGLETD